jgi:formate-dependent nitrite reductase membrane component NrfD
VNLFVADPEWGWWIILYFFLGGIAAGAYFMATLIDLVGGAGDRELARVGYWIAFPLIGLCGLFLTIDLERPERFWHMLFRSEVVHEALRQGWPLSAASWRWMVRAPLLKYWSPMSVGSWALTLFGLCSGLSFLGSLWPEGRLARLLRRSLFGKLLAFVGCLVGFFIASYTGALLTATNQPVWSDSVWVAPLFLTSAASTGIATLLLLAHGRAAVSGAALERLEKADLWALGLELSFFGVFLASLGSLLLPVLETAHGKLFVVGTLLVGLFIPLAVHLRLGMKGRWSLPAAAACALLGGLVLRYGLLTTPPELLRHGPALAGGFGPEDGRPRGGGRGADAGNYPAELHPRSKVFVDEQP